MSDSETLKVAADAGKGAGGEVRRWLLELKQADKREKKWREKSADIWKRYRQAEAKKNSFDILWSNTETLRPAIYSKLPTPDVRRRFRDDDPVGKLAGEVMQRCASYALDAGDANEQFKAVALDVLLPGRACARVRYVPSLAERKGDDEEEQLEWQQIVFEHVQWDDVRLGPGKHWREVPWIAFRHRMSQDELCEKFGDALGKGVPLDELDDDELKQADRDAAASVFRTAEVWEIWDKEKRECLFLAPGYKAKPLKTEPDPLKLAGFFPMPKPLYAIEDSSSMVPLPIYEKYAEQADELDRISARINKIIDAIKVRGIYDSTIAELSQVMRGSDNDLIPAQGVAALIDRGGIDKAIWMMPIEAAANVLKVLFEQRDQTKQVIYEITGISDILRGATNAAETATAQQIKNQWGTLRLQRLQGDIQRFIRDLIRLGCEITGQQFVPETLAAMTGLKIQTAAEKAQIQAAVQMGQQRVQAMQAQGQQIPPQVQQIAEQAQAQLAQPTWDDVLGILRNDMQRQFRIDIETNSTVADVLQTDMQGLQEVLTGIVNFIQGIGPAVQLQAFPVEGVKAIVLAICRRARLGLEVEDAMQMIKAPPPPAPPPEQAQQPPDQSMPIAQMQEQGKQQLEQARMQHEQAMAAQKIQSEQQLEQYRMQQDANLKLEIAKLDAESRIIVAQINSESQAKTTIAQAQISAQQTLDQSAREDARTAAEAAAQPVEQPQDETGQALALALEGFREALGQLRAPRRVVRDETGRVAGIE